MGLIGKYLSLLRSLGSYYNGLSMIVDTFYIPLILVKIYTYFRKFSKFHIMTLQIEMLLIVSFLVIEFHNFS